MNKLFTLTFGSFFRTLGRFLFYILFGLLLSYILKDVKLPKIDIFQVLDTYAETTFSVYTGNPIDYDEGLINSINVNYFASLGLNSYNKASVYNCSSTTTCTGSVSYDLSYGGIVWKGTMANYGFDFVHDTLQVLSTNHLYSYSYNFCEPTGITTFDNNIYIGTGMGNARGSSISLLRFDYYKNDNMEWLHYDISGANAVDTTNCYTMYNLFNYTGSNANTIKVNLKTSSFNNQYIGVLGYKLEDLGATNGLTTSQVQNIIDNSGLASATSVNQVQQSVNQVQQELSEVNDSIQDQIEADEQNTQDIIDNQNQNSQNEINSQKVCNEYDKRNILIDNKYLNGNGIETSDSVWGITDYIKIKDSDITYNPYPSATGAHACYYDINKNKISCFQEGVSSLTVPTNAYYIRASINKNMNKPTLQVCKNGNQAMNDVLTDDSSPNISGLNNSAGWLPAGPVDSILNLPLSFLTNLNTNLSKSCQSVDLPLPYVNKNISLPCVNSLYAQINGLPNWINTIGIIASAFILFSYLINLYKYIDDTLTFRENNYIDNWSGV